MIGMIGAGGATAVARSLTGDARARGARGGAVRGESRGPREPGKAERPERLASGGQEARSERPSNRSPPSSPEPRDRRRERRAVRATLSHATGVANAGQFGQP